MEDYPYLPVSPWYEMPGDIQPPVADDKHCDVVVIGGGFTGLSTAIELKRAGVDVLLLEKDVCGMGSSGRNAGHLTPTIGKDVPSLLKVFGREKTGKLIKFAEDAVHFTERRIDDLSIECDYHANGNIMAAVHPRQERALKKSADIARTLGAEMEYLDGNALRKRQLPARFLGGTLDRAGGVLHPGKLVLGLRRAALGAGVRIHEQSGVRHIEEGPEVTVRTEHGKVTADQAVIATNAYTPALGKIKRKVAPVVVTLLETGPLTDRQLAAIGWPGREGIYTAHEILESYHLTERNTIVAGSKQIVIPYNSRLASTRQPKLFRRTTSAFRERFPELVDLRIRSYWGGYIAFSSDFLPLIGATGRQGNLHYGIGFAGHGVAQAIYMGSILTAVLTGRGHPALEVLKRRTWPWPPEPVRWAGGQLIRAILTRLDKRTDRSVRKLYPGRK